MVKETCPVGTRLARLMATDQTSKPGEFKLNFSLESEEIVDSKNKKKTSDGRRRKHFTVCNSGYFYDVTPHMRMCASQIEPNSGDLLLLAPLDPNLGLVLKLRVTDEDQMEAAKEISVKVRDVNDHAPKFARGRYEYRIREGEKLAVT